MFCGNCGVENEPGAKFCCSCGEPMVEEVGMLGPYELRGELGRGAMARVWRAWDPNLEREVAIKEPLFDSRLGKDVLEEMGQRFVREGRTAARLQHSGIVTIYAADVYDGRPAIVMELVEGATLGDILENGPLAPNTALDALDQLLDAVGYAHGRGVVHRDIKPDNIFVDSEGRVKLADFGIARVDDGGASTRATVVGTVLGTPGYMSPEQATGGTVDARSDLFSIGVVGYEMLSGRNPFGVGDGTDATTLLYRIVHEPVRELPESAARGLPADLRPAIMAALAKEPAMRPQDAAAFKAMLHGGAVPNAGAFGAAPASAVPATTEAGRSELASALTSGQFPKWLPYVAVAAVCIVVLLFVFLGATSGTGGGGNGGSVPAVSSSASSVSSSPVYLAVRDGKVAIYTNSSAQPYEITDVEVALLSDDAQAKLDEHIGFSTVEEAEKKVEEYREKAKEAREAQEAEKAEAEAKAAAEKKAAAQAKQDYIIPNSGTDYLSRVDLGALSDDELSRAQNEIWARHGRRFKNNWLQSYFDSKSWYSGTIAPDDFLKRYEPTDVENKNAELIQSVLNEHGYDVNSAHPN